MSFFKKDIEDVKIIRPPVLGWIEKKLSHKEMDYLWRCIDNKKESHKQYLAGNISGSFRLIDKSDWFFLNTLSSLCNRYKQEFVDIGASIPINQKHPYFLHSFWVNYQKQTEYNPIHTHTGVFSFVVWMKIPTKFKEQNKKTISNCKNISAFQFNHLDIIGGSRPYTYEMNPEVEGTILFFPSQLPHQVYPFYNCGEERISISGNISLNTAKLL